MKLAGALLLSSSILLPGEYTNRNFGFALELKAGWVHQEVSATASKLHVKFGPPPERGGGIELSIRVQEQGPYSDVLAVRAAAEASVGQGEQYSNSRSRDQRLLGEERPTFLVDVALGGETYTLQQFYLLNEGSLFILQTIAKRASYEESWEEIEDIWSGFRFIEISDERRAKRDLQALAEKCGSEIRWSTTWQDAARRSREEKKLILWRINRYRGFTMPDSDLWSALMETEIVELVNERYIPLKDTDLNVPFAKHEVYGMSGTTFGEAYLLVDAEGNIVREKLEPLDEFLIEGLSAHPDYPGPPLPKLEDPLELARAHARRGELSEARALLGDLDSVEAYRLAFELDCRAYDAESALQSLSKARARDRGAFADALKVDEALVRVGMGQFGAARTLLEDVVASADDPTLTSKARFQLGVLHMEANEHATAEKIWQPLLDDVEDRYAWRVAGILTSPFWSAKLRWPLEWRDEVHRAVNVLSDADPLAIGQEERARQEAIHYLLRHQRKDGSWLIPADVGRHRTQPPHDFKLAGSAICGRALLGDRANDACLAASKRALDYVLAAYDRMRAAGEEVLYMDYGVWSRGFALLFLADSVLAGTAELDSMAPYAERMLKELDDKQKPGGGWSYYVSSDLESKNAPTNLAMSFTTAAICIALLRSMEAGFDVPTALVDKGLVGLKGLQTGTGTFAYSGGPGGPLAKTSARDGACRAPICNLALVLAGQAEPESLAEAMRDFTAHTDGLAKEAGKQLMHTGLQAQGSHYVMFDYAFAAETVATLPVEDQLRHAIPLVEAILATHLADGSFLGSPLVGAATETGLALSALNSLKHLETSSER